MLILKYKIQLYFICEFVLTNINIYVKKYINIQTNI